MLITEKSLTQFLHTKATEKQVKISLPKKVMKIQNLFSQKSLKWTLAPRKLVGGAVVEHYHLFTLV